MTGRQRDYLEAVGRHDVTAIRKYGVPAVRLWAESEGLIERGSHTAKRLTDKAKALLTN